MSITCTAIKVIKLRDIMHISFQMLANDGAVEDFNLIFVWYLFVFTVKSKLSSKTLRTFLMKDVSWLNSQQKENTSLYFISVKIKLNCRAQALLLNYFDICFILVRLKLEWILKLCFYKTSTHDMGAYMTCNLKVNKGNAKRGVSPRLQNWPVDLDLWPWISIGSRLS